MEAAGRRGGLLSGHSKPGPLLCHQLAADAGPCCPADSEAERVPEGTTGYSRYEGRPDGRPEQRRRFVTHPEALLPGPMMSQIPVVAPPGWRRLLRPLLPGSPVPSPGQQGDGEPALPTGSEVCACSCSQALLGEQRRRPFRITTADTDKLKHSGFRDTGSRHGPRPAPCPQARPLPGTDLPLSTCRHPQHLQALMVNRPAIFLDGSFPL